MSARLLGGRYELHTMIGRGGMAAVWRGVDTRLDRPVAVKVLDATARLDRTMLQQLDREARTVARLAHPNIVAIYDMGTDGDTAYLVMELIEGDDLQQRLARGPLAVGPAVEIAAQVCAALEAAHGAGVVHRDIKPANILLTGAGAVKVCDFGVARMQQGTGPRTTNPALTVGTCDYMAPEQAAGGDVDERTDLYALGCVLYAMLAGSPPFSGSDPMDVLRRQVHERPLPLASHRPDIPADLDALVGRLLAKNPADRPAGADQVRARLAHISGHPIAPSAAVATGLAHPAHARATVVSRTQTLPVMDTGEDVPVRNGVRLGPAGIVAVALGAAALAAVLVAGILLFTARSVPQAGAPGTTPTVISESATPTASPSEVPAGSVDAVRATLQSQVAAGAVDDNAASDLNDRLDEIARDLDEGETRKAAKNVGEVRRKLAEFHRDDMITTEAYTAILASLEMLASTL